jgi:hypothetical protein
VPLHFYKKRLTALQKFKRLLDAFVAQRSRLSQHQDTHQISVQLQRVHNRFRSNTFGSRLHTR